MALSLKAFLGLDGSGFELGMKRAESSVNKLGHSLEGLAKDKIAELFGGAALEEGVRRAIEFGHHMANVAKQMGITTDEAQQLDYQMSETNGSIEAVATAFKKLKLAQAEVLRGSKEMRDAFKVFGINPDEAIGLSGADLYKKIGGKVGSISGELSPMQQEALQKIMGRGSDSLIPSFKSAPKLPSEMIIPGETVQKYDEMDKASKNIWRRIRNMAGASAVFATESLFNTGVLRSMNDPDGRRKEAHDYIQNRVGSWGWVKRMRGINDQPTGSNGDWQGPPRPPSNSIIVENLDHSKQEQIRTTMEDMFNAAKILSTRNQPSLKKEITEIQTLRTRADSIEGAGNTDEDTAVNKAEATKLRFDAYNRVRALINPFPDRLNLNALQSQGLDTIRNPTVNLEGQTRRLVTVMEQLVAQLRSQGIIVPHAYQDTNFR